MSNTQFYYLKNIRIKNTRDYARLNDEFPKRPAQARFGPPLTKEGNPDMVLLNRGYIGIYVREEDPATLPKRGHGRARITLQGVESGLEKKVRILRKW
ncbi:MAG TPA: hypothetical protein VJI32_02890 [Candidatus Nanoarchaeia archaeon]|nr:hypothetical protein [Candidatus Nanoarchaeia archaeon]